MKILVVDDLGKESPTIHFFVTIPSHGASRRSQSSPFLNFLTDKVAHIIDCYRKQLD